LVKVDSGESGLVIVEKGLMFWASSKLERSSSERRGRESIAMQGEIKCVAPWRGTSLDLRTYVAALAKIAAGQVTVAGNSGSNPKN
jgi:hypothetical protein